MTMIWPTPEATSRASRISSLDLPNRSATVMVTAGRMPQAPAVGAAQMRPMEALTSEQERARAIILFIKSPEMVLPESMYLFIFWASPLIIIPMVSRGCSMAEVAELTMTS